MSPRLLSTQYNILIIMMNKREASIVADTGTSAIPKIKSGSALTVKLTDIMTKSYVQSDNSSLWYKNCDQFLHIPPCKVQLRDLFNHKDGPYCSISRCGIKNCKTCNILITEPQFKSCLTNNNYHTHGYEHLNCKSSNVVYGIECDLCGLIYVGETMGQLNKRISGHRFQINHGGNQLIYQHFNQPDHSILSMRVRILEKIYHHTNNGKLSTHFRRQREEHWIRELGTAVPYGCNDRIDSVGNLTSPACSSVNVMNLFNYSSRRKRSHGHRHYTPPIFHDVSFNGLIEHMSKPLGIHHIRTKLFSVSLSKLKKLSEECSLYSITNHQSSEYKLTFIIMDIYNFRSRKPTQTSTDPEEKHSFLNVLFANKGIDAINISNILHNKVVKNKIPPYFQDKTVPVISYTYTNPIAPKIFNYKRALHNLNINDLKAKPPSCSCTISPHCYQPAGHIITGDLSIVSSDTLRGLLTKGPKYRPPRSINWRYNFKLLMDSVEDFARKWAKREEVDINTLSEWVKAVRSFIRSRIRKLKGSMKTNIPCVFKDPEVTKCLKSLHDKNTLLCLLIRFLTILFLFVGIIIINV